MHGLCVIDHVHLSLKEASTFVIKEHDIRMQHTKMERRTLITINARLFILVSVFLSVFEFNLVEVEV